MLTGTDTCRTRYFLGNDNEEYKWKEVKGVGNVVRPRLLVFLSLAR